MTKQELEKLKEDLIKEKNVIQSELESFATKNPVVKGDYQSIFPKTDQSDTPDEKAQSITSYEEKRAVEQSLEMRLKQINETIAKIDAGSYGVCSNCQVRIEGKRLQAIPVTHLCIDCAKKGRLL